MTTHLQGRSSWGPETISRCLSSISSFGHSNSNDNSSSSSRRSSKPEPEAIELHEWKTSTSRRPSVCNSETSTKQRQNEADKSTAPRANASPASSHGGVVRWLGHKGSTFWGSLFLLLLLGVCSPFATEATAPTSQEPILDQYVSNQEWQHSRDRFDGWKAPPRRLNTVAAWAAEVESSLRISPQLSLYLGVFLTLSGSLLMAGGSTLMKLGLSVEDADALSGQSCDQQWVWGFAGEAPALILTSMLPHALVIIFMLGNVVFDPPPRCLHIESMVTLASKIPTATAATATAPATGMSQFHKKLHIALVVHVCAFSVCARCLHARRRLGFRSRKCLVAHELHWSHSQRGGLSCKPAHS